MNESKTSEERLTGKEIFAFFSFGMACGGTFFIIISLILSLLNLTITNTILIIITVISILPALIFIILREIESRQKPNKISFYFKNGNTSCKVVEYESKEIRDNLLDPDETIIKDERIFVEFSYPLTNNVKMEYGENRDGFTRMDLFKIIYEGYKKIYTEEEEEVGDPGLIEGLENRNWSYGKYGIWGHYLNDLYLEGLYYNSELKLVTPIIGS